MVATNKIIVNQAAICAALNLSSSQVNKLESDGVISKTGRNRYDLVRSVSAYIARLKGQESDEVSGGGDYYAERARLTKAQADERELKVKISEASLIPIETAQRVWCDAAILIRNNMLALPSKLSHVLCDITDKSVISEEIRKEVIHALTATKIDPAVYIDE